ncbi:MAG: PIN domain-containing protein [Planctomycetes bacterium]|nr:PIN domain-containing protein [Planctomycetota bacterium]
MAREIFVDTGGFYALLAGRDDRHREACRILHGAPRKRQTFVTTDYVLDETATLLKARRLRQLLRPLFETLASSAACRIEWTDSARFERVLRFFLKHQDQDWSFTDCASFVVMQESGLSRALTKDEHFRQAGFEALLVR